MPNTVSTIEKKIDFLVQKKVNEVIREILSDPRLWIRIYS
jgi:hypothetical protein